MVGERQHPLLSTLLRLPFYLLAVSVMIPYYWMATNAFKTIPEIVRNPPTWWVHTFTLDNFFNPDAVPGAPKNSWSRPGAPCSGVSSIVSPPPITSIVFGFTATCAEAWPSPAELAIPTSSTTRRKAPMNKARTVPKAEARTDLRNSFMEAGGVLLK